MFQEEGIDWGAGVRYLTHSMQTCVLSPKSIFKKEIWHNGTCLWSWHWGTKTSGSSLTSQSTESACPKPKRDLVSKQTRPNGQLLRNTWQSCWPLASTPIYTHVCACSHRCAPMHTCMCTHTYQPTKSRLQGGKRLECSKKERISGGRMRQETGRWRWKGPDHECGFLAVYSGQNGFWSKG